VTEIALQTLPQVKDLRLISLHLGGGCSATASRGGVAVDTSMGMTPLEGLVMATRCGDIDPAIVSHLVHHVGMSLEEVDHSLNKRAGWLGLCGDVDMRNVIQRGDAGDPRALLALEVTIHRLKKYVGAYAAVLGGLDALVFTAGIGENAPVIRARLTEGLGFLGIEVDASKNAAAVRVAEATNISAATARVQTLVIPTNEELAIARATAM
jgi:acetate kinase